MYVTQCRYSTVYLTDMFPDARKKCISIDGAASAKHVQWPTLTQDVLWVVQNSTFAHIQQSSHSAPKDSTSSPKSPMTPAQHLHEESQHQTSRKYSLHIPPTAWDLFPDRVWGSSELSLDIFSEKNIAGR